MVNSNHGRTTYCLRHIFACRGCILIVDP